MFSLDSWREHVKEAAAMLGTGRISQKAACYYMCYGVATISRLLQIVGLFCRI